MSFHLPGSDRTTQLGGFFHKLGEKYETITATLRSQTESCLILTVLEGIVMMEKGQYGDDSDILGFLWIFVFLLRKMAASDFSCD